MRSSTSQSASEKTWPYTSLLILGIFGARDQAGKAVAVRGMAGLFCLIIGLVLLRSEITAAVSLIGGLVLIASGGFMTWSITRYIRSLDELSRLIQLEAFAWSYGGLFVLALALVAFGEALGFRSINPIWILIGELLRGLALVLVARRYR